MSLTVLLLEELVVDLRVAVGTAPVKARRVLDQAGVRASIFVSLHQQRITKESYMLSDSETKSLQ